MLNNWRATQGTFPKRRTMMSAGRNRAGAPTLADLNIPAEKEQG
jgi:hypothetical protein